MKQQAGHFSSSLIARLRRLSSGVVNSSYRSYQRFDMQMRRKGQFYPRLALIALSNNQAQVFPSAY